MLTYDQIQVLLKSTSINKKLNIRKINEVRKLEALFIKRTSFDNFNPNVYYILSQEDLTEKDYIDLNYFIQDKLNQGKFLFEIKIISKTDRIYYISLQK